MEIKVAKEAGAADERVAGQGGALHGAQEPESSGLVEALDPKTSQSPAGGGPPLSPEDEASRGGGSRCESLCVNGHRLSDLIAGLKS